MHQFHEYLCQQLEEMFKKKRVVVLYDPRSEFAPFFDRELKEVGTGHNGLPRVFVGERMTFLARYDGSFLAVRAAVEPIAELQEPEPLIIYVPGVSRDPASSVLMELEKGGNFYEPQLKRLALNVLRKRFSDGQIDEMLRPASVGYDDIVSFLRAGAEGETASVLRSVFDNAPSEALLTQWLANDERDVAIGEKGAMPELLKLIAARLGLPLPEDTTVSEARGKTLRYLLVSEFRSDLACAPPPSVSMVPTPPGKEHVDRIRAVATGLRSGHADRYVAMATRIETDLGLRSAGISASDLGNIDTFRFEEQALLAHAGELVADKDYGKALGIVTARIRSFWVDREVGRQVQWEACRLVAELGREIERVRPQLAKVSSASQMWVQSYAAEDGWFAVDQAQRRLESWIGKMDEEPETERGLKVVRREYEELLKKMAEGFTEVLAGSKWTIPGALHQTRVFPDVVQPIGGRVAYILVDAMRFEMGVELARQLQGAQDLVIRPAIASLPSITPVGMAALLPGASASFSVIEYKDKLAARIDQTALAGLNERLKFFLSRVPDLCDFTLGDLLEMSAKRAAQKIGTASLVLVRSQEIDAIGEADGGLMAQTAMSTVIGNVARAVRKLAAAGMESFVITADHGYQFSIPKDDDMKTDSPGGDTIGLHRRCWIGHGGVTPPGTIRIAGAELGYETSLDFVFPTGLGVFKAGGGLSYHHGGTSLQELVIPVISLRMPKRESAVPPPKTVQLGGLPDKIATRTVGIRLLATADLFAGEPLSLRVILVSGGKQVGETGMAIGAPLDRRGGVLSVNPGAEVMVGLLLTDEDCLSLRVVVQDVATDAVLTQSDEIPVALGIRT